jgi:NAD+ synthase (glutamine-hydrolysing)
MVFTYMIAQLYPSYKKQEGWYLILGSSNLDKALTGDYTKYDNSAADICPIAGLNRFNVQEFADWFGKKYNHKVFEDIAVTKHVNELRPIESIKLDKDKNIATVDDEFSFQEIDVLATFRKDRKCGPVDMFVLLCDEWNQLTPREVAKKVKTFFVRYSVNRHKASVAPPGYHCKGYGCDDNRYDMRQIIYDDTWEVQFNKIDNMVRDYEKRGNHRI